MPFASCRLSLSYQDKLILHLITPLAFLVSIQLAKLLAVCVDKKRRKPDAIRNTAQDNKSGTVLIQIGMLLYPSLMTRIFSAFRCFPVVMGSQVTRSFLEGDFSIACFEMSSIHLQLIVPLAIVGIVVYTVGFPLYVVVELWRHRDSLYNTKHKDYMMTKLRLGSFVESYEPKYWYWEPIVILYKMMLVGGLSVVEQHSPIQLFCAFLICFGYLLLVIRKAVSWLSLLMFAIGKISNLLWLLFFSLWLLFFSPAFRGW